MKDRSLRRQRGAEIVEFLITLPAMLLVWFLLVEMGVALIDQAVLANASRAAAREAIRGGTLADAQDAAERMYPSMISWNPGQVPSLVPDPQPAGANDPFPGNPGDPVTVTITYDYPFFLIPVFGPLLPDWELTGRTTMRMISN